MAIKSVLNPGVIAPERKGTIQGFQNFITGGSDLGTSAVASAANKIVNFQRGAAGVAPRAPDLGSIIQTLSTNILSQVERKVDSINQNVNNIVYRTTQKLEGDYRNKVGSIDADMPSKILQNFLSLYDKAIGYIQFLANPRNVRTLGDNLRELRNVFAETFEVAKNIRKTILRVVDQLSNLPTASAGGSGLNLDIKLPGSSIRRAGAPLARMVKGRGGMLLGAAGMGLGTKMVTSALAQTGDEVQAVPTETGGGISQPLLEKFSAILDRFDNAIRSLSVGKKESTQKTKPTSTAAKKGEEPQPPPAPPGPADFSGSENAQKAFNYFKSQGYSEEQAAGIVGNLMQESGVTPTKKNQAGFTGIAQWDPTDRWPKLVAWAKKNNLDPNAVETQLQYIGKSLQTGEEGLSASTLKAAKSETEAARLFLKGYERSGEEAGQVGYENRMKYARDILKKYKGTSAAKPSQDKKVDQKGVVGVVGDTGLPGKEGKPGAPGQETIVNAAPTQAVTQKQLAQQVAQPPVIQTQPQVNMVPLNMNQQGAQGMQKPPTTSVGKASGPSIPFLPSSNTDNFLTLYSKMVYNIVDG